jgi:hypothetical protein
MAGYRFFRPMRVLNENQIDNLAELMASGYLYVSDEHRNSRDIWSMLYRVLSKDPSCGFHVAYEIGNLDGLLIFADIIRGFKCRVSLKYWDPSDFGKSIIREGRRLVDEFAAGTGLVRMNSETADPKIVKLAGLFGFGVDAVIKNDFMWDGKLYDRYILGRTFPTFPAGEATGDKEVGNV